MKLVSKYMNGYIALLIIVALVSATGGSLITDMAGLNTTFGSTGLGSIFSATILGLVFAGAVFYAVYKGVQSLVGKK